MSSHIIIDLQKHVGESLKELKQHTFWKGTPQICVEDANGRERIKKLFVVIKLFFYSLRAKERITGLAFNKRFMRDTKKNSKQ